MTATDVNGCSTSSSIDVVTVVDPVAVPVIQGNGPACEGEEVQLSIPVYTGSSVSYIWTVPDPTNVSGLNTNSIVISPVTDGLHDGNYSVQVVVDGCSLSSSTYELLISEEPASSPSVTLVDTCVGGNIQLFANATGTDLRYIWTGPNGWTSTLENPSINSLDVSYNGQYNLVVENVSGCSVSNSIDISGILPTPSIPTIVFSDICDGDDIILSTSTVGTIYEWIGPLGDSPSTLMNNGLSTTNDTVIISSSSSAYLAGQWQVRITDSNGCTSTSAVRDLSINEIPTALAFNNGPVCPGESVELTADPFSGARYEWRMSGNPAILSTSELFKVNTINTTSTYELTVMNGSCVGVPAFTTVTVNAEPVVNAGINYTMNADCSPEDLTLTSTVVSGNIDTYLWTGPNGFTSSLANPVITNATSANNGTYQLVATDINGCLTSSSVDVITVVDPVAVPIIQGDGPGCEGDEIILSVPLYSGSSVTYDWTLPSQTNVLGLNTNQLVISPLQSINEGDYSVEVIVDDCTLESAVYELINNEEPTVAPSVTLSDAVALVIIGF